MADRRGLLGVGLQERILRPDEAWRERDELLPLFREQLVREHWRGRTVLDVVTGDGRVAFLLARWADRVIGIDADRSAVRRAQEYAAIKRITNVAFHTADPERTPYHALTPRPIDAVVTRHCASDVVVRRAARVLDVGGTLVLCAHHMDHWRETGDGSPDAFSEVALIDLLTDAHLAIAFLGLARDVVLFEDLDDVARYLGDRRVAAWTEDGRWEGLQESFRAGERHLTLAHLVAKARRVPHRPEAPRTF